MIELVGHNRFESAHVSNGQKFCGCAARVVVHESYANRTRIVAIEAVQGSRLLWRAVFDTIAILDTIAVLASLKTIGSMSGDA